MISKDIAVRLMPGDRVHYIGPSGKAPNGIQCAVTIGPHGSRRSNVVECRVNGNVQTWKTRPEEFRVPIKYGMREYGSINEANASWWHRAQDCTPQVLCQACGWTSSADRDHGFEVPCKYAESGRKVLFVGGQS